MEFLRRRLGLILRLVVSALAVYFVARAANWQNVWDNVRTMDVGWLLLAGVCILPTLLIVSWRWRMLLGVHGVHLRFWRVFELVMIGQFFSSVGVGTTGGDVFKIFYVARAVPQRKAAVAFTVIVDRVIGLMALLLIGVALSFSRLPLLMSTPETKALTGTFYLIALGGATASILACFGPYLLQSEKLRAWARRLPLAQKGTSLFAAYERTARALGTNLIALVGSIPSHLSVVLMGYCILRAMHIPSLDLLTVCSILVIVNMLIALPISISGIGVREQFFTWFFLLLGIDRDHAVTFSITFFAFNILWCLAGGPFYFLYRHETHTPAPDVAEADAIFSKP